jgi:lathosterol oxidase
MNETTAVPLNAGGAPFGTMGGVCRLVALGGKDSSTVLGFTMMWLALTVMGGLSILTSSGLVFVKFYLNPTFEQWRTKTNPAYPPPFKVKEEILQTVKGLWCGTLPAALGLWLSQRGVGKGYCGVEPHGWAYLLATFFIVWLGSDFLEWGYHQLGHRTDWGWLQHKPHHNFYNPSPFSVIADDCVDQLFRASPLLLFPLLFPVNMDMLFFTYGVCFYIYGVYLHWGYELNWPDAHHKYINSSFQHYLHHTKSTKHKAYHTGFFIKAWDEMVGTVWKEECFCAKCEREKGKRSFAAWEEVHIPDYTVMLTSIAFWTSTNKKKRCDVKARVV